MPLACSDSFCVLTCLTVCTLQEVSTSHLLRFFPVLTCPSICTLQFVSVPHLLGFFPCPNLFLPLYSLESECPSFTCFPSFCILTPHLSPLIPIHSRLCVPLIFLVSLNRLISPLCVSECEFLSCICLLSAS